MVAALPKPPHRPTILGVAGAIAKVLLISAGLFLIVALVLLVAWWRVVSWPYRQRRPRDREALYAFLGAAAALLAVARRHRG